MEAELTFRIAFFVLLGGLVLMRVYFALRLRQAGERFMPDQQAIEREGRGIFTARVVAFVVLLALVALYATGSPWMNALSIPLPSEVRWAGSAVGLASLALFTWTQVALGKEWSPQLQLRAEHHLVCTGPYKRVRHPMYTAMLGMGTAFALVTANWFFVLLALAMIAGLLARVPREEQMMVEEFGEEYKAYMQRTGRFFPKVNR
jgi:protein-S-isoprenylcysteine O-methyltransferase Ste14